MALQTKRLLLFAVAGVQSLMNLEVCQAFLTNSINSIHSRSPLTFLQGQAQEQNYEPDPSSAVSRRDVFLVAVPGATMMMMMMMAQPQAAEARLETVNRPDLLPEQPNLNVIQTEKFLTKGQVKRMDQLLAALERDTGYRVRVLCQAYPNTPGLAIRDYWDLGKDDQKDDKYVVLVVDQFRGKGNVLNFNVGDGVKFVLPNIFWNRLTNTYGTMFYVRDNGIDFAITNAVEAIVTCLRSEEQYCVNVPDIAPSMKSLGM